MPSVTALLKNNSVDIKICKWLLNGTYFFDTVETAIKSCVNMFGSWNLYSMHYISNYSTTDQEMVKKYISLSSCGRYILKNFKNNYLKINLNINNNNKC